MASLKIQKVQDHYLKILAEQKEKTKMSIQQLKADILDSIKDIDSQTLVQYALDSFHQEQMNQYDQLLAKTCEDVEQLELKIKEVQTKTRVINEEQKSDIVSLNVGGRSGIKVSRSLLTSVPNTILEAMFSGRHKLLQENGEIYLDRDPQIFLILIQFLRNGMKQPNLQNQYERQQFNLELEFWGLKEHVKEQDNNHFDQNQQKNSVKHTLGHIFSFQPEDPGILWMINKWKELGPINIEEFVTSNRIQINQQFLITFQEHNSVIYYGQKYDGGCYNGIGRKVDYQNFTIYEGQWHDGRMHGQGRLIDGKQKKYYIGRFDRNEKQGQWAIE